MTQYNPNCPKCGVEIDFIEHDYGVEDNGDTMCAFARGSCPSCHTDYKWYDVYVLSEFMDLEEDI